MEEGHLVPPPPPLDPLSRPSSTSSQSSMAQALQQLPSISSLAANAAAAASLHTNSTVANPTPPTYPISSPASTTGPGGNHLPECGNCHTSTTPLWRRDEQNTMLCNACGLFLKLHGRPRPISLKTDVIKSRNRVKTMRPDMANKKKVQNLPVGSLDANGADLSLAMSGLAGVRRASQKSTNGHGDEHNSPISRTTTPNLYHSMYHGVEDAQFQAHGLANFTVADPSTGRATSPMNGDHLPETHEQLLAANASLKTRVSELEVIQELYRGRLQELEREDAQGRQAQENEAQLRLQLDISTQTEATLRNDLEESHRRENILKRRLEELEVELKDVKDSLEMHENGRAKKPRLEVADVKTEGQEEEQEVAPATEAVE